MHIQNIGLGADEPLNGFWAQIYKAVGVKDVPSTVQTFVDEQDIRAYYNSHIFSVNPSKGLLRQWYERFAALVTDADFQSQYCQDDGHHIFLHQAVLSALIATTLDPERVRALPPEYSYPYNLHQQVPADRRTDALNDLICIAYEKRPLDPTVVDDIVIHEPLRSWLSDRVV